MTAFLESIRPAGLERGLAHARCAVNADAPPAPDRAIFPALQRLTGDEQRLHGRRWHSPPASANSEINQRLPRLAKGGEGAAAFKEEVTCMTFRPLHDRVLVRRVEAEEKTAGGIIIPDTAKEKPQEGEVISVGAGTRDENGKVTPLDVKAGDKILFGKWSGTEVRLDGEDLLIMKESDILGIVA
jgi:chaperonin GroES